MKSSRNYPVYTVNKHAEGLLVGGHPWVYENDILSSPEAEPENGTLVDVVSTKGAYLGTGFLSLKSKIRVRLISRNTNDTFDAAFWKRRVEYAWAYRKTVLDCFTHTGSFALNTAKGGAARVTTADISAEAIAMAQRNAQRNNLTNMDFLCEDTFELLPRITPSCGACPRPIT
ncbi:methyltransferase domain-containing protein [Faecalibacterium duncaniae]|uniref:methyltransferase domain-containing protein n=1 Tax=Faecalibacterium duncaniae (strain DSM 17677 / JCM 31915 / A2-165) TaxID=411483 RepID=UPI003EDAC5B3